MGNIFLLVGDVVVLLLMVPVDDLVEERRGASGSSLPRGMSSMDDEVQENSSLRSSASRGAVGRVSELARRKAVIGGTLIFEGEEDVLVGETKLTVSSSSSAKFMAPW